MPQSSAARVGCVERGRTRDRRGAEPAGAVTKAARSHFDREAAAYESGRRYRRLAEPRTRAIELLELTPSDRLLDIGCGTGATLRQLAPLVAQASGVDLSPEMIKLALLQAREQPRLDFAVAESAELPFPDATFTAALCTFSFHHYPRPEASGRELARVLEEGGRLVLADACRDHWRIRLADWIARRLEPAHVRFYRTRELRGLLERAGFAEITIRRPGRSWFMIATARKPTARS
jgi:ubiquinone/menaquinone biosynthesis C-methylase UbiE